MHACTPDGAQSSSVLDVGSTMAEWSMMDREWPPDGSYDPYSYVMDGYYQEYQEKPEQPLADFFPPRAQQYDMQQHPSSSQPPGPAYTPYTTVVPRGENPREIRNKAEKQRRDKLNHSISELASMVPPVVAANKKIDKTGVLRLTAHYLRAYQYVFGDSIGSVEHEFTPASMQLLLTLLRGFLLTTTYKGLIVVVSQNIQEYLGHTELDLLGQNIFNYVHPEDHQRLKENLMPDARLLGPNGELLIPDEPTGKRKIAAALAGQKRRFLIRFKKHTQRSEPATYVPCYVEGTLRKSDRACRAASRCCQVVRRARARGDNPCSSGNDVVFIGMVRPTTETFISEKRIEAFRMEYRTRHSVDGEIMECEQRISLVAGYMTHEVNGVNAMNFIHRDDVRWVIFSLREMYDQHRLVGESCYRLMAKSGQFIYMKTRGTLDVEASSRAVRSFVCTNTVVDEKEGKHLIEMMKKRCMMVINQHKSPPPEIEELKKVEKTLQIPESEVTEDDTLPVHDLEKVILHLVTNLPSPQPGDSRSNSPERAESPSLQLAIIPPRRERILSAIEKIYSVIKAAGKNNNKMQNYHNLRPDDASLDGLSPISSPSKSPVRTRIMEQNRKIMLTRRKLDGFTDTNPNYGTCDGETMPLAGSISSHTASIYASEQPELKIKPIITDETQPLLEETNKLTTIPESDMITINPIVTSRKRSQAADRSKTKKMNNGHASQPTCTAIHPTTAATAAAQVPEDIIPLMDPFEDFELAPGDDADVALDNIELPMDLPWGEQNKQQ